MKITKIPQNTTLIFDGITIIQQPAGHVPATFGNLNIYIFRYIIKFTFFYMSSSVDFVCDKYNPLNIKDSERRQYCVLLMRIRKHLSSFGNSACLTKTKNLLFYLW